MTRRDPMMYDKFCLYLDLRQIQTDTHIHKHNFRQKRLTRRRAYDFSTGSVLVTHFGAVVPGPRIS